MQRELKSPLKEARCFKDLNACWLCHKNKSVARLQLLMMHFFVSISFFFLLEDRIKKALILSQNGSIKNQQKLLKFIKKKGFFVYFRILQRRNKKAEDFDRFFILFQA